MFANSMEEDESVKELVEALKTRKPMLYRDGKLVTDPEKAEGEEPVYRCSLCTY